MATPLRVLILEDHSTDAELLVHELRRAGFDPDWQRVDTEADYLACLDSALDVILADYSLPQWDAPRALRAVQERGLDVPFILVSSAVGEDIAVECMKQGAVDYLLKDRLARLGLAVVKALEDKRRRAEKRHADESLRFHAQLLNAVGQAVIATDAEGNVSFWNRFAETLYGWSAEEAIGHNIVDLTPANTSHQQAAEILTRLQSGQTWRGEFTVQRKDGSTFPALVTDTPIVDEQGTQIGIIGTSMDITARKRAEEALRESEEIFRAFIDQSDDAIALTNSDGIIVEWNPALTRITGTSREQALGQPLWIVESWHFDDNNSSAVEQLTTALEAMIRQALAGETPPWLGNLMEMSIRHLDNTRRVVQSISFPINTQHHRMLGTIMRDITERKRIEETLREKAEELDRFFSLALDLLCIANVDGYFLRLNNAWETTLGYPLEDLEGKQFLDLVHPDDLESTLGAIAELSADQQVLNFVNRYRCQDGSYRWIEWRSMPYQGRLIYAAARDITERRQIEEALRQSEEQYRTLFDQSTSALLLCEAVIDEQGTPTDFVVLQTNRVFTDSVNVRAQDMVGQHLTHVFPNIKDTSLFNAMIRTATTRQPEQLEFHSVSLSRDFDVGVFSPHQGQVATSYADITARKQVEEHKARLALEQEKARILQSFVEDVSHEFRTPLTVIHSGLELLERMAAQQRTQSPERIAELEEQTMYISDLVDAMLTMTKLDSVSSLPATATAINSVVATLVETFQPYATKHEVALRLVTMEESPFVLDVSDELERAVGNLVKNAIQFTPPNGMVTLRTSADSHHVIIEVSDTGTGISEEALPSIFERFYRANTARTGRHAGLGLAIAKRIIELHGGQIEVMSHLNEGSTFRVLLPLANEPEGESERQED